MVQRRVQQPAGWRIREIINAHRRLEDWQSMIAVTVQECCTTEEGSATGCKGSSPFKIKTSSIVYVARVVSMYVHINHIAPDSTWPGVRIIFALYAEVGLIGAELQTTAIILYTISCVYLDQSIVSKF